MASLRLASKAGGSLILLLLVMFFAAGGVGRERQPEKVAVIGINTLGQAVTHEVPVDVYTEVLATAVSSVQGAIIPALRSAEGQRSLSSQKSWQLRTVGVGVGLSGQIGMGPIINVTLSSQLRLVFTNSTEPTYPE